MSLLLLTWGGSSRAGTALTSPTVDIWSNSLALIGPAAPTITPAIMDDFAVIVKDWFISGNAEIADTERLEWTKLNEWDIQTGRQVSDPTNEHLFPVPPQGIGNGRNPLTTCYRVSIDNATRNPRTRGGFFAPRCSAAIGADGRFDPGDHVAHADAALSFLQAINDYAGLEVTVGVWSRVDRSVTAVERIRVSDVPDDVSSRKNALRPAYSVRELAG